MEKLKIDKKSKLVLAWLKEFVEERNENNTVQYNLIADQQQQQYQVLRMDWDKDTEELNLSILFHIAIKPNGKVWILANQTDISLTQEFLKLGLTHQDIVLGNLSPKLRAYSDFALA
jgi:XisI protein